MIAASWVHYVVFGLVVWAAVLGVIVTVLSGTPRRRRRPWWRSGQ